MSSGKPDREGKARLVATGPLKAKFACSEKTPGPTVARSQLNLESCFLLGGTFTSATLSESCWSADIYDVLSISLDGSSVGISLDNHQRQTLS